MEALEVERAIAECTGCAARSESLSRGFAGMADVDPAGVHARILAEVGDVNLPDTLVQALNESDVETPSQSAWSVLSQWLFGRGGRVVIAMAAIMMTAIALPSLTEKTTDQDVVRLKGSLNLTVHRARGGAVSSMQSGDVFKPGDRVRFTVTLAKRGQVMVLGRESSGVTYVAYPLKRSNRSVGHEAGRTDLPGSVKLDASLGREEFFGVFCPLEFSPKDIILGDSGPQGPEGCSFDRFEMVKSP
jgi:hypothetical protein